MLKITSDLTKPKIIRLIKNQITIIDNYGMTAQFHSKATAHISERGRKPFKIYLTAREGCFFFRLVKKKQKTTTTTKKPSFCISLPSSNFTIPLISIDI